MGSQEHFLELRGFHGPLLRPMGSQGLFLGLGSSHEPLLRLRVFQLDLAPNWGVLWNLTPDWGFSETSSRTWEVLSDLSSDWRPS